MCLLVSLWVEACRWTSLCASQLKELGLGISTSVGITYLVLAADVLAQPAGSTLSLADAAYRFEATTAEDSVGTVGVSAGDVDGDGNDDLLLVAESFTPPGADYSTGKAYVMLASDILAQPAGTSISLSDAASACSY